MTHLSPSRENQRLQRTKRPGKITHFQQLLFFTKFTVKTFSYFSVSWAPSDSHCGLFFISSSSFTSFTCFYFHSLVEKSICTHTEENKDHRLQMNQGSLVWAVAKFKKAFLSHNPKKQTCCCKYLY